eukprot:6192810-Pleurochrysis_carterae.AAC.5
MRPIISDSYKRKGSNACTANAAWPIKLPHRCLYAHKDELIACLKATGCVGGARKAKVVTLMTPADVRERLHDVGRSFTVGQK